MAYAQKAEHAAIFEVAPEKKKRKKVKISDVNKRILKSNNSNYSGILPIKIGIIGFGATGVSTFYHLVNKITAASTKHNIEIYIFDPSENFSTGLAYGHKTRDELILNMRAETMSVAAGNLNHFVNSLSEDLKPNAFGDYLPRQIFGKYLKETFRSSLKIAKKHHIKTRVIKEKIIDLKIINSKIHICTEEELEARVDQAILCIGNTPSTEYSEFNKIKNYIRSPYTKNLGTLIPKDEKVIILGSSLTAIDAALSLQKNGHSGKITFLSRGGALPKVQGKIQEYELRFITLKNIKKLSKNFTKEIDITQIYKLFKKELEVGLGEKINWDKVLQRPDSVKKELRNDIHKAENGKMPYQSILGAT